MEKLELKHLAAAFSNNQKVFYFDEERELIQICKIVELREEELTISNGEYQYDVLFDDIKLLSHPIFYLTKEIEVNGEKFIPCNALISLLPYSEDYKKNIFWEHKKLTKNTEFISFKSSICKEFIVWISNINSNEYGIIQKLYEWHFDIHGLIEKGLAIDINTLNPNQ